MHGPLKKPTRGRREEQGWVKERRDGVEAARGVGGGSRYRGSFPSSAHRFWLRNASAFERRKDFLKLALPFPGPAAPEDPASALRPPTPVLDVSKRAGTGHRTAETGGRHLYA